MGFLLLGSCVGLGDVGVFFVVIWGFLAGHQKFCKVLWSVHHLGGCY
jgi:hypothetical protein